MSEKGDPEALAAALWPELFRLPGNEVGPATLAERAHRLRLAGRALAAGFTRSRPVTVSDEAVVAAANRLLSFNAARDTTDARLLARAALTAALPHLTQNTNQEER